MLRPVLRGFGFKKKRMYKTDAFLQFIRRRLHQTAGEVQRSPSARAFGIVPVDSILGRVQTVRRHTVAGIIHKSDAPFLNHFVVCDNVRGWENYLSYDI